MRPEKLIIRNIGPFQGIHTVDFAALGDIFLVCGKTGAGKTTVFDAISFAFYGDASGERKGISKELRSHFAPEDEESAVVLEFSLAGKRFRIRRTVPLETVGPRSGKLKTVPEEVTLEEYSDGSWTDRSPGKKSETDAKILSLVGLSYEEFSKIVLLPQGEFARFLRQNSNERKAVLSKLFPVSLYGRVTELARDKARDAKIRLNAATEAILALQKEFNREAYPEEKANRERRIAEARAAQAGLRKKTADANAQLEKARAAFARKSERKRLEEVREALARREEPIESLKAVLDADRRATPLTGMLDALEDQDRRISALGQDIRTARNELAEKTEIVAALERRAPDIEQLSREREALIIRREQLATALDLEQKLEAAQAELGALQKELSGRKAESRKLADDAAAMEKRIADLAAEAGFLEAREQETERARAELEKKKRLKTLAEEYDRERHAVNAHAVSAHQAEQRIAETEQDLEIARAEARELDEEAERAKTSRTACELAALLQDGKPCPVCGALDHPAPAKAALDAIGTGPRKESAARRITDLEKKRTEVLTERARINATLAAAEARLGEVFSNFCAESGEGADCIAPQAVPLPAEAAEALKEASARMQDAVNRLGASRSARREADELARKKAGLEKAAAELADISKTLELRESGMSASVAADRQRYLEAFGPGSHGFHDAGEAIELCSARLIAIDAELNSYSDRLAQTRNRIAGLGARRDSLEHSLTQELKARDEARMRFVAACKNSGFADELDPAQPHSEEYVQKRARAVRAAILNPEDRSAAETETTEYYRLRAETETRIAALGPAEADNSERDPELVLAELDGLAEETARTDEMLQQENAALAALEALRARFDALEKERAELTTEHGRIARLSNDLAGTNPLKTSFDAWILGMYLEEITAFANLRLERMSEGRYRIQLNGSYRRGNNLGGLELEIRDAHTGRTRPTATLSGGETFMASISLALGLADSIQSRSGGIQLDAVFIDEGFGSLDESSLERAISILDEIRGHRMVGIISHVGDLKNRIPNRIEIIKTATGSSILDRADGQA